MSFKHCFELRVIYTSAHVVQQFQTGDTFLKHAFKEDLCLCLVQNSI